jgi:isoleucyl-tRNA synthetase
MHGERGSDLARDRSLGARPAAAAGSSRSPNAYERWDLHIVYREIHALCDQDLSAFYLNVLKDRLYTEVPESPERRSAQSGAVAGSEGAGDR